MPCNQDLTALTLLEAADLLRQRRVSPVELASACLDRIAQLDATLNSFITVTADLALEQARAAEAEIARGEWRGPLHGIPVALKDLIDVAGVPTTAASELFRNRVAHQDAAIVTRLKQAGAVLIGKTNLHEFAYGGSSVIGAFGAVRNPHDPARTTGGSSGGSAAAVAAHLCSAAIGTDTAGSIRLPAAYCGIVGLKPTYGLVSARGVVPLAWSFDHVGPLARTVADAATVLNVIAGYDEADITSRELSRRDYAAALDSDISKLRVGVAHEIFFADVDSEICAQVEQAIAAMGELTAGVRELAVPVDTDRTVHLAEAWTYHAQYVAESPQLYQPETLRRIRHGAEVSAADYIRARQRLEQQRRHAAELFADVDVIVTPTVPLPPPTIADLLANPDDLRAKELVMLRNTRPFNVLGLPAISVACGTTAAGLPIGLQIAAAPGWEDLVLAVAHAFQKLTTD
ncbi:MAG: amidase [Terriglobales bacterium]